MEGPAPMTTTTARIIDRRRMSIKLRRVALLAVRKTRAAPRRTMRTRRTRFTAGRKTMS